MPNQGWVDPETGRRLNIGESGGVMSELSRDGRSASGRGLEEARGKWARDNPAPIDTLPRQPKSQDESAGLTEGESLQRQAARSAFANRSRPTGSTQPNVPGGFDAGAARGVLSQPAVPNPATVITPQDKQAGTAPGTRQPFIAGANGQNVAADYAAGGRFSSQNPGTDPSLDVNSLNTLPRTGPQPVASAPVGGQSAVGTPQPVTSPVASNQPAQTNVIAKRPGGLDVTAPAAPSGGTPVGGESAVQFPGGYTRQAPAFNPPTAAKQAPVAGGVNGLPRARRQVAVQSDKSKLFGGGY